MLSYTDKVKWTKDIRQREKEAIRVNVLGKANGLLRPSIDLNQDNLMNLLVAMWDAWWSKRLLSDEMVRDSATHVAPVPKPHIINTVCV
jgi:hypothetical protein